MRKMVAQFGLVLDVAL